MLFMLFYSCGQDLQSWVHRKPNYSSSCNGNTSFWESQVAKTHIFFFFGGGEVHLHYFYNRNLYLFVNDIIYLEKPTEVTDHHSRAMDTKPRNTILMARSLPLTSNIETQLIGGPQVHSHKNDQGTHCPVTRRQWWECENPNKGHWRIPPQAEEPAVLQGGVTSYYKDVILHRAVQTLNAIWNTILIGFLMNSM